MHTAQQYVAQWTVIFVQYRVICGLGRFIQRLLSPGNMSNRGYNFLEVQEGTDYPTF